MGFTGLLERGARSSERGTFCRDFINRLRLLHLAGKFLFWGVFPQPGATGRNQAQKSVALAVGFAQIFAVNRPDVGRGTRRRAKCDGRVDAVERVPTSAKSMCLLIKTD